MNIQWYEAVGCRVAPSGVHRPVNVNDIQIGRTRPSCHEQEVLKQWNLRCVNCNEVYVVPLQSGARFNPGDAG